MRFFLLDYVATLRERKVLVALALLLYAVLAMPQLLLRPPPHVTAAVESWFGVADPFAMFMYVWTDLAMNKLIAILAVVFASGVVVRERELHILPVLLAKPLSLRRYFVTRALSAAAVVATLYLGAHLVALPYFAHQVAGFRAGIFLASMVLHVWSAVFATLLCATLAVVLMKRQAAALGSFLLIMTLVGASFAGFYNPAWRDAARINPFALGIEAVGHMVDLQPQHVLVPMTALAVMCAALLWVGSTASQRVEV